MTRKLYISALALTVALAGGFAVPVQSSLVNAGALTVAWQAQQVSRWQADRFGPIVASDTMWTIASYYGRQHGINVYDMMDAIVAANPRVFIDNRPDRMMDGYYLVIPQLGQAKATQPQPQSQQPVTEQTADNGDTVQFKAEELRDLRDRLAGSIEMIESLQSENATLQSRLNDVTAELEALKQQLAEDRAIDEEIDAIAGELATQVPGVESSQERVIDGAAGQPPVQGQQQDQQQVEQPVEQVVEQPVEQVVEQPVEQVVEQPVSVSKPAAAKKAPPEFIDWLLQAPQLYVLIAVPVLLLLILLYMAYVRRIKREFEADATDPGTASAQDDQHEAAKVGETDLQADLEPPQPAAAVDGDELATEPDDAQPDITESPSKQADTIDANAVVTGLAAITGAAVVVDSFASDDTDSATDDADDTDDVDAEQLDVALNDELNIDDSTDNSIDDSTDDTDTMAVTDVSDDYSDDELAAMLAAAEADSEVDAELLSDMPEAADTVLDRADSDSEVFDLSEFEVATDDPLLAADADAFYDDEPEQPSEVDEISIEGLNDDDDFAKLLASLEAPTDANDGPASERQPPLAKREPKLSDDSFGGLSLADEEASDDGEYVSIDSLLNDADEVSAHADDEPLLHSELELGAMDESKTPAAQLDLAQAYIDMGELDDARALLKKIVGCDDADADREAALLLQQLDSQSGR